MSTAAPVLLPDVGEGLTEAVIVSWHVAVGDTVEVNQPIVDIETEKSVVELPCPTAGTVAAILAAPGETVAVGSTIVTIQPAGGAAPDQTPAAAVQTPAAAGQTPAAPAAATEEEPKLLVGYGAREGTRRRRRGAATAPPVPAPAPEPVAPSAAGPVRAKPPVRRLAKTRGVDLAAVTATGPGGTTTRDDVLAHGTAAAAAAGTASATPSTVDGGEERIAITGMRKHTAAAMVASAFTAPHVTEFVTVDITRTLELREQVLRRREFRDTKVSPLVFVARAYLLALARTPMANARWDDAAHEIVLRRTVNLGIAAATPRGLVVPNIRGAQALGLHALATAVNELAATARAGRTPPAAMAQGTTTITNVGVFGVDTGTPILNPGETAILAVGTVRRMAWVVGTGSDERIEPRSVLQLALSFDHRVIDGQEGSQLLADTAEILHEPGTALL